jgi:hypothetical protein
VIDGWHLNNLTQGREGPMSTRVKGRWFESYAKKSARARAKERGERLYSVRDRVAKTLRYYVSRQLSGTLRRAEARELVIIRELKV